MGRPHWATDPQWAWLMVKVIEYAKLKNSATKEPNVFKIFWRNFFDEWARQWPSPALMEIVKHDEVAPPYNNAMSANDNNTSATSATPANNNVTPANDEAASVNDEAAPVNNAAAPTTNNDQEAIPDDGDAVQKTSVPVQKTHGKSRGPMTMKMVSIKLEIPLSANSTHMCIEAQRLLE